MPTRRNSARTRWKSPLGTALFAPAVCTTRTPAHTTTVHTSLSARMCTTPIYTSVFFLSDILFLFPDHRSFLHSFRRPLFFYPRYYCFFLSRFVPLLSSTSLFHARLLAEYSRSTCRLPTAGQVFNFFPLFLLYISSALFRDTPTSSYSVQVHSIIHKHKENVSKFSAFTRSRSSKSREISQCSSMISQSIHSVKSHHEFLVQSPVTYYDTWHGLSV